MKQFFRILYYYLCQFPSTTKNGKFIAFFNNENEYLDQSVLLDSSYIRKFIFSILYIFALVNMCTLFLFQMQILPMLHHVLFERFPSKSISTKPVKRMAVPRQTKKSSKSGICKICGDQARIINYGALSCQPCKTFFRRNGYHPHVRHFYCSIFSFLQMICSCSVFYFVYSKVLVISLEKHDDVVRPVVSRNVL